MPNLSRGVSLGLVGILAAALLAAGCQTTSTRGGSSNSNHRGLSVPLTGAGARTVEESRKLIEAGDTTVVVPRLLHVISNDPDSNAALDARYWLAVAYTKIGSERDAIELFSEYLRLAPSGKYAADAERYRQELAQAYDEKYQTPEEMDAAVRDLARQVQASPGDFKLQIQLADALWKRGDYESAAEIYNRVIREKPEYANEPGVRDRVEPLPEGGIIVLTPTEIQRREIERQPLAVLNTTSFRSGRDLLTREALYYAVSGQVVNRGESVLYGVQVTITIYGFGNMVYDTSTVHIGRLNPRETRAFSVRFSNFDNIDEISRYDCVASFDR